MRVAKRARKVEGGESCAIPAEKSIVVICFDPGAGQGAVPRALAALGLDSVPDKNSRWFEPGLLTVKLDGAVSQEAQERLAKAPGVRQVAAMPAGHRLVTQPRSREEAAVRLSNGAVIGGGTLAMIAGPCSVESEKQVCEIAAMAKAAGAVALRGGAFKPRTSPYSFGGLGERGLEFLARAREKTGMPFATEALEVSQLDVVARYADMIQIGSRNMSNFPLLFKAGAQAEGKPILLKRGYASTIEEFLDAAEYVLLGRMLAGAERPNLIMCERGIRTFETATRFTLDVAAIPIVHERTHLPVVVDPSHPAGDRRYVAPLARAAVAAGADGLLIEVHTDPDRAWCDGDQSLAPDALGKLMVDLRRLAPFVGAL